MNIVRTAIRTATAVVLSAGVLLGATGHAFADTINAVNGSVSAAVAGGDSRSHVFSVVVSAQQMSGFDAGQYVDYQVIAQDVTGTPGAFKYYPWQGPYKVNGVQWHDSYLTGSFSTSGPVSVGTYTINGVAGHHYHVWVDVAYWTGTGWVTVMVPVTSYLNTVYSNGIAFDLTNSFALT